MKQEPFDYAVARGFDEDRNVWLVVLMIRLSNGSELPLSFEVEAAEQLVAKLEAELAVIRSSQPN